VRKGKEGKDLRYLSLLEARNYAESTLKAIVSALKKLTSHLPDSRKATLAENQVINQDASKKFLSFAKIHSPSASTT
jgi:hypothetical protein